MLQYASVNIAVVDEEIRSALTTGETRRKVVAARIWINMAPVRSSVDEPLTQLKWKQPTGGEERGQKETKERGSTHSRIVGVAQTGMEEVRGLRSELRRSWILPKEIKVCRLANITVHTSPKGETWGNYIEVAGSCRMHF